MATASKLGDHACTTEQLRMSSTDRIPLAAFVRPEHAPLGPDRGQTIADHEREAEAIADRVDDHATAVREQVVAMRAAAAAGDLANHRAAKVAAEAELVQLEHIAARMTSAIRDAAGADVRRRLDEIERRREAARQQIDAAPGEPDGRAPVLSCVDRLLAVLPTDPPSTEWRGPHFDASGEGVKRLITQVMTWSDITAFGSILRQHPSHEIARRFSRLGAERRTFLLDLCKFDRIKQLARAREMARGMEDRDRFHGLSPDADVSERALSPAVAGDAHGAAIAVGVEPAATKPRAASTTGDQPHLGRGAAIAARIPGVTYEGDGQFRIAAEGRELAATIRRVSARGARLRHGVGDAVIIEVAAGLGELEFILAVSEQLRTLRESADASSSRAARFEDHAVTRVAAVGVASPGEPMPYLAQLQASFGHHDLSEVRAHQDAMATDAARELGAEAYTFGDSVAFRQPPTLHTAAHEAAHVVQQRAGVHLTGGIDRPNDGYERQADTVADAVVAGRSAVAILDVMSGGQRDHVVQRAPHGSSGAGNTTGVTRSDGPAIAPPTSAINRTGFIDNSEGASIRTGPRDAGGVTVREAPLPPTTRVFASGVHPHQPDWWYVTANVDPGLVRGYVQALRVNTDLPEPLARLYEVACGDTVESLAVRAYGDDVRDGHDLRYYENVLLYANQHGVQHPRAGIRGVYQAPSILGGGGDHIELVAGHRIWIVSASYARALEGIVPSGSLTGGAVAMAKQFAGHLEDILHSVEESANHLGEVAAEYAQAIRDHMAEIIGVTAAFLTAEAASVVLAASPTGMGQILAALIQLTLAMFGARGAVEAGAETLSHGRAWLDLAWSAKGDRAKIAASSSEFLKMLVSIAMAALTYLGARANARGALKIASSIDADMPALAAAGSRASAAAQVGPHGSSLSPVAAAAAMMVRHPPETASHFDDYGEEASYQDEPTEWRAERDEAVRSDEDADNIGLAQPKSDGTLTRRRVRHVPRSQVDPALASESGVGVLENKRLGITRDPLHHTLPQEELEFFRERGFPDRDIDNFTVEMDRLEHEMLHGGNQALARKFWPEREWNTKLMKEIARQEALSDTMLTRESILSIMEEQRDKFGIANRPFVRYRRGR
jgi:hypothetical protein